MTTTFRSEVFRVSSEIFPAFCAVMAIVACLLAVDTVLGELNPEPESRQARLVRVVDADTFDVDLLSRFAGETTITLDVRLRLKGASAPEVRGPEKPWGDRATEAVRGWFARHCEGGPEVRCVEYPITVISDARGSFGRVISEVLCGEESLTEFVAAWNAENPLPEDLHNGP